MPTNELLGTTQLPASSTIWRPMLRLALPALAEQLLTVLVGYTDWWLAGHYLQDAPYLAAMGLIAYVLWLLPSMFAAVAIGATALVARFVGAGQWSLAVLASNQAVTVGLVMGVLATVATAWGGPYFVYAMQLEGEAASLAIRYLWVLVPVVPAIMIEQVGIACLRGAGDTVSGFVVKTIVVAINVAVSMSLVIGWGPIPRLGWDGLAIGTAVGHGVGGLLICCLLLVGRAGLTLRVRQLWPDAMLIWRLLRIGIPGGIDTAVILTCHMAFVAIINRIGTLAAAAHGMGVTIESLAYLPGTAFQVAAMTLTGQALGARDPRRAVYSALSTFAVGGALMVAAGFVFYCAPEALTAFFTGTDDSPTARATVPLLRIVAWAMPSLAVVMILTGALRGAGDTRWTLAISLVGFFCVRLPGACWLAWDSVPLPGTGLELPGWGWGVAGAWYAMLADNLVRSLLVVWRFAHGGWKWIEV